MRYIIGDTHFGHENIIEYTERPFDSVEQMNHEMVKRWNNVVDEDDSVIHLGDVRHHPDPHTIEFWFDQLNGDIMLVKGNHDDIGHNQSYHVVSSCTVQHGRYEFYLEHQPVGANLWSIHGHSHNNDMLCYPFIHPNRQTVNVSVELLNYRPLSMDRLVRLIERGWRINTVPEKEFVEE